MDSHGIISSLRKQLAICISFIFAKLWKVSYKHSLNPGVYLLLNLPFLKEGCISSQL